MCGRKEWMRVCIASTSSFCHRRSQGGNFITRKEVVVTHTQKKKQITVVDVCTCIFLKELLFSASVTHHQHKNEMKRNVTLYFWWISFIALCFHIYFDEIECWAGWKSEPKKNRMCSGPCLVVIFFFFGDGVTSVLFHAILCITQP